MGISEVQRRFNAYGSGELPALELRRFIRATLSDEPTLSEAFVALTDAYRRANLIDANLQAVINADIEEVTAPNAALTMIRPPGYRAANSTNVNYASDALTKPMPAPPEPMPPMAPMAPMARGPAPKPGANKPAAQQPPANPRAANQRATDWPPANPPAASQRASDWPPANPRATNQPTSDQRPANYPPAQAATGAPTEWTSRSPGANPSWRAEPTFASLSPSIPQAALENTGATGGSTWDVDGSLNEVAAPLYPGAVIRDRFVLVEELGRGGMGVVYKAYDRSRGDVKDRYVAIKVLNEEFKRHPLAVRSLQREARKAQRLAHPNIVGVHDFDRDAGNVYMVMELLSGRSLEQVLREDGRGGIPLGPAMDIIKCLGAALSYAHEQDIVHCDFKPSNAFMTRDGKVKVLDFGIARAAPSLVEKGDATLFDAGQLGAISPAYASLEMLQRETPDIRDDVYALACVAYELLTGVHPYQRIDAIKAYQTGLQPRPIRKLSRSQWRALKQGLEFTRSARAPSIDALVRPLVTPPNKAIVWAVAAAACLAVVAIGVGLYLKWPDVRAAASRFHSHTQPTQANRNSAGTVNPPSPAENPAFPSDTSAQPTPSVAAPTAAVDPTSTATGTVDTNANTNVPGTAAASYVPVRSGNVRIELEGALASPAPTQQWADTLHDVLARYGSVDAQSKRASQVAVQVFVAAATDARTRKQYGQAESLLTTARSFDEHAPEVVSESVALERDRGTRVDTVAVEQKRAAGEILKEQFEAQCAAGDVVAASATAASLARALAGSNYAAHDIPQLLAASYAHRARTQFAGGKVNESLQTLADGRRKFGRSTDLKDLEERYVQAADIYDRLGSAVVLNVPDITRQLDELKSTQGSEYEVAAQMLAQTLADRIADQRAAGRGAVADKLLEAGKQIFPSFRGILTRGTAGVLNPPDSCTPPCESPQPLTQ